MTREELYSKCSSKPIILDGATGSNLQRMGMPVGVCPELWILEHRDALIRLQTAFVEAGTEILYAPTFSGNRIKLAEYGVEKDLARINRELIAYSKEAAGGRALVAGDLTMTGQALRPMGSMELEDLIDIYKEQASCQLEAGVDLFVVETMMSLAETRAAIIAIREICDLPVIASMTFQEDGRTLYGTDPVTAVVVLQSIGADVVGLNCSTGPKEMIPVIQKMKEYANVPILAKPNAGLPVLEDGKTVYPMGPEEFAGFGPALVDAGANLIGGCCGTRPEHIELLCSMVSGLPAKPVNNLHPTMLASERMSREIRPDGPFIIIGEKINPTGKKDLQEALRNQDYEIVEEMALSQEENGAHILDVNVGTNGIDEKEAMCRAIEKISEACPLPLSIDSSSVEVIEAALRSYPGRALVNSVSLEKKKIRGLLPLVKKYGAAFVLLPLSDKGLPESLEEKIDIILEILDQAQALGISRDSVIADGLVTTVGANKRAALEALETIRYCKEELGIPTTAGLSNISFGLPARQYVNAAFVSMAISAGLTSAIANPANELLTGLAFASDLLMGKAGADEVFIGRMAERKEEKVREEKKERGKQGTGSPSAVYDAVLKGKKDQILRSVDKELAGGASPDMILNLFLIPAINRVGELFEEGKYFLPQLIASATAMETAVHYLEPMIRISQENARKMPAIVIATVEGDIHDIGKNLVAMMLRNHGFEVHDLGKDVPASKIIGAAREYNAKIIVLSALMTTTMMRMKDTVKLRDKEKLDVKIMIGGAVTTESFAREIGADGYSGDAADAVRLAKELLEL